MPKGVYPRPNKQPNFCSVDGCAKPCDSYGFCRSHAARFVRHGDPLAGRKFVGAKVYCSVEGCTDEVAAQGWCNRHYSSWRRHGDPLAVRPFHSWTQEDDDFLRAHHGSMRIEDIAITMGLSRSALRARITRLGISKFPSWSEDEEAALVELYQRAGPNGVLKLKEFCAKIGRGAGNVSRKAKLLGLATNPSRRVVEQRKIKERKYVTDEELRTAQSENAKRRILENGHPRGMKGKKHSNETRLHLSRTSKAAHLFLTEEQRAERALKSLKTRAANGSPVAPQIKRGSWQAGWREIGGKRNFYRSRWEANYARYLEWLKTLGEITEWQHEPETFWFEEIRRGVRSYKPDFRVWENGGSSLHEVKGWMDDRSRVCLKRMAKYYPNERIVLVDGRQYRSIRLKVMRLVPDWEDSKRDTHA